MEGGDQKKESTWQKRKKLSGGKGPPIKGAHNGKGANRDVRMTGFSKGGAGRDGQLCEGETLI